jgi:hypothetical protein
VSATTTTAQIVVFVDKQPLKLDPRSYTPRELLKLAGENPDETTLVRKRGHELEKLTELDKPMDLENGEHFVVYHNAPTPVS